MGHTLGPIMGYAAGRVIVVAAAGAAVCLSGPADAGLRFGPGAVLGLLAAPMRMMAHTRAVPEIHREFHRHAAHPQGTAATAAPAPAPAETSAPPSSVAAAPAGTPPVVEARAQAAHATEPSRTAPSALAWPTASPSVYEDLLGYVLWPGDYADRLWGHGYGDIMSTPLAPTDANRDQAASMIADGMCSTKASALADHLVTRTGDIIGPTPEQKAALDELRAGLGEAIERGRAAVCTGTGDPLKRTVDGLWTMWDATLLMRAPLETFYDSLTPAQKTKLAGGMAASKALARACAEHATDWPSERLTQALGPDQQQRLTALRQQSAGLVKLLAASCPQETEATPMDRLTAAGDRMNALLYVVMSMSPALSELHAPQGGPNTPPAADH
ncbi:MAG TPA: hypothetical protein VG291_05560 [Xanthobacteraceae bacterium]|nr:hypothetical protein [Xanthobacteraceae bacterium]